MPRQQALARGVRAGRREEARMADQISTAHDAGGAAAGEVAFDPFDPAFQSDPYPVYHWLRAAEPVRWIELSIPQIPGIWLVTRYADVSSVLRDERFSAAKPELFQAEPGGALDRMIARSMLMLDPPDHTRLRTLVLKAFTPRVVESLRPRIQGIVDARLDAVRAAGAIELIADLAAPLPVIVIAELLGVPAADRGEFKRWGDDLAVLADGTIALGGLAQAERSAWELEAYLDAVFAARRVQPRDDLISALVAAQDQQQRLDHDELIAICMLLLIAGHETTTNLIGNGILALLRHPDQLARLRSDPGLLGNAVEELLRWDSPVQLTSRTAKEDLELGGKRIRKGDEVDVILGAANRDPEQFPDPDRLDVARPDPRPLSFGHGIHFCLGASLARLEGQIAIGTILRRLPDLALATDDVSWRPGFVLRGLAALPLRFDAEAARRVR
jgi:cytochrome P450